MYVYDCGGQTVARSSFSLRQYHGQHSFQQIIFLVRIFWGKAYMKAFDVFSCPGGREFDELSLSGGGAFDHHS